MASLPIFSPRERLGAGTGFLFGLAMPSVLGLFLLHHFRHLVSSTGGLVLTGTVLLVGIAWLVAGLVTFFWTLALVATLGALGDRAISICWRIWVGGLALGLLVGFLHRHFEVSWVLPLILLFIFRPKPDPLFRFKHSSAWLEGRESSPFLWGICAALGALAISASLGSMNLSLGASLLGGSLSSASLLAQGFILGVLLQGWTRQRWTSRMLAILAWAGYALAWVLKARGVDWLHMSWPAWVWPLGILAGDWFAARDGTAIPVPSLEV